MHRLGRTRRRRLLATPLIVAAALVLVVAVAAVLVLGVGLLQSRQHSPLTAVATAAPLPPVSIASADGSATPAVSKSTTSAASSGVDVEVPDVKGKTLEVAEALVTAAGLTAQTRVADPPASGAAPDSVLAQWPQAGAVVQSGASVVITYQPRAGAVGSAGGYVVVIDAGHQAKADLGLEPIGPGSKTTKPKVAGGATGVATKVPEFERALQISSMLRDALVARGVKVVMVRTANDVDIPNSTRARIGNDAKADLVVRIHLDSTDDASVHGVSTQYPSGNHWVKAIEPASRAAADVVEASVAHATGEDDRGIVGRADLSGFNYSTRPVILVECGFMSNAAEDNEFAAAAYRQNVAAGIAAGVMAYLGSH